LDITIQKQTQTTYIYLFATKENQKGKYTFEKTEGAIKNEQSRLSIQ
jgi:hypothetical protein